MAGGVKSTKKVPKAPLKMSRGETNKGKSRKVQKEARQPRNLIESTPKTFAIGKAILPKRDLTRYVRWPKYIHLQRQERILMQRLKIPPAINQFSHTLDKPTALKLFSLMHKYRVETKAEKKARLLAAAVKKVDGGSAETQKPLSIHYGLNHVIKLIEKRQAKLVVIAHDVNPIELVLWVPQLCVRMNTPYCIVKGKARLGQLVDKKKATVVAFTRVKKEDMMSFDKLVQTVRTNFNERGNELRRMWGGGVMSQKSRDRKLKIEKAASNEINVVS